MLLSLAACGSEESASSAHKEAGKAGSSYDSLEKVNAGPIQVIHEKVTCKVDHSEDHLVAVGALRYCFFKILE